MTQPKTVLLGVSGGIAAYKTAYVASGLHKKGFDVNVIMTESACEFITPLTFETLTDNKCCTDTFDRLFVHKTQHISLAKKADLLMVAPATADIIAKLACGIADDMLTTTALACTCPRVVVPAMNTAMYDNPVTQDNLERLKKYGWIVIDPASGLLACGDIGRGRMPEPPYLIKVAEHFLAETRDLEGVKVLITAGPTQEALDPVRYITNHSTGKMGYAIAEDASARGADVTLVSGVTSLNRLPFVKTIDVVSAQDMFEAVTGLADEMDIIIKAAAVADYKPATIADNKIKKQDGDNFLPLERTHDILKYLGEHKKPGQFLCGFSMETENVIENSRAKLKKKNLDLICCNSLRDEGAGFGTDTNIMTLISSQEEIPLPKMTKAETGNAILNQITAMRNRQGRSER